MQAEQTLNIDQVAEILNMKAVTIKRYAREGLLDSEQSNGEFRFLPDNVEKFKAIQEKLR